MNTDCRALCAELVEKLDALNCSYNIPSQSALVERARTELAKPQPEPVPVNERPWEREGWCDKRGYCWMRRKHEPDGVTWRLIPPPDSHAAAFFRESLPYHALPVPTP